MSSTRVEIKCPECGGTQFSYPEKPKLEPSDPATCAGCGLNTTIGILRKEGEKQVKKLLSDTFGSRFKPRK